jgi:hypothetical protein
MIMPNTTKPSGKDKELTVLTLRNFTLKRFSAKIEEPQSLRHNEATRLVENK